MVILMFLKTYSFKWNKVKQQAFEYVITHTEQEKSEEWAGVVVTLLFSKETSNGEQEVLISTPLNLFFHNGPNP